MLTLAADESLSCVGTFCWTFGVDPRYAERRVVYPIHYEDIKHALLRGAPMAHPSIVVSRSALLDVGGYNERYRYSADVEMYDRLLAKYRAVNIPKPLLGLRRHGRQTSSSRTALEEGIDIFSRRLSCNAYSPKDAAMVRTGLSDLHLHRVRRGIVERKYFEVLKDLKEAFLLSPKTFLWRCIRLPVVLFVPARFLNAVRQLFESGLIRSR